MHEKRSKKAKPREKSNLGQSLTHFTRHEIGLFKTTFCLSSEEGMFCVSIQFCFDCFENEI